MDKGFIYKIGLMWILTSIGAILLAWAFVIFFKSAPKHIEEIVSILVWIIITVILLVNNYDKPIIWITGWLFVAFLIFTYKEEKKRKPKKKEDERKYVTKHWRYKDWVRYN